MKDFSDFVRLNPWTAWLSMTTIFLIILGCAYLLGRISQVRKDMKEFKKRNAK